MRKLKAIWLVIWSRNYAVYTCRSDFGMAYVDLKAETWHMEELIQVLEDRLEAEVSVEYVKSLLTEI